MEQSVSADTAGAGLVRALERLQAKAACTAASTSAPLVARETTHALWWDDRAGEAAVPSPPAAGSRDRPSWDVPCKKPARLDTCLPTYQRRHAHSLLQEMALPPKVTAERRRTQRRRTHSAPPPPPLSPVTPYKPVALRPHFHLNFNDIPFVVGKSATDSHAIGANLQRYIATLKQHQPVLCNALNPTTAILSSAARTRSGDSRPKSCTSQPGPQTARLLQELQAECNAYATELEKCRQQLQQVGVQDRTFLTTGLEEHVRFLDGRLARKREHVGVFIRKEIRRAVLMLAIFWGVLRCPSSKLLTWYHVRQKVEAVHKLATETAQSESPATRSKRGQVRHLRAPPQRRLPGGAHSRRASKDLHTLKEANKSMQP